MSNLSTFLYVSLRVTLSSLYYVLRLTTSFLNLSLCPEPLLHFTNHTFSSCVLPNVHTPEWTLHRLHSNILSPPKLSLLHKFKAKLWFGLFLLVPQTLPSDSYTMQKQTSLILLLHSSSNPPGLLHLQQHHSCSSHYYLMPTSFLTVFSFTFVTP